MTNGMNNEDQVALFYHLMAAHPNQSGSFPLTYPNSLRNEPHRSHREEGNVALLKWRHRHVRGAWRLLDGEC